MGEPVAAVPISTASGWLCGGDVVAADFAWPWHPPISPSNAHSARRLGPGSSSDRLCTEQSVPENPKFVFGESRTITIFAGARAAVAHKKSGTSAHLGLRMPRKLGTPIAPGGQSETLTHGCGTVLA